MNVLMIPIAVGSLGTTQKAGKRDWINERSLEEYYDQPDDGTVKTSQNNWKNPGDSRRLVVTQTSVKKTPVTIDVKKK